MVNEVERPSITFRSRYTLQIGRGRLRHCVIAWKPWENKHNHDALAFLRLIPSPFSISFNPNSNPLKSSTALAVAQMITTLILFSKVFWSVPLPFQLRCLQSEGQKDEGC